MRLKDKVAIVTGAAQGLGQGIAMRFAREGASVVVCDVNAEGVKKVSQDITALGQKSLWFEVDVSKFPQVEVMAKKTIETLGRIDVLVNNAGGSLNTTNKFDEVTEEAWDLVVDVNLKGVFLCSKAVAPYMKVQKSGRIINVASAAGRYGGQITGIQYSSAKAGVLGLTRQLARDLGAFNITANGIAPGLTLSSPRVEKMWKERKTDEEKKAFMESIPMHRFPTVDEQASVVLFLASEDASAVSGVTIDVNCGWMMC